MDFEERLERFRKDADKLSPTEEEIKKMTQMVTQYVLQLHSQISADPDPDGNPSTLARFPFTTVTAAQELKNYIPRDHPIPLETLLDVVQRNIIECGVNPAGPGMMGYIPSGGLYPSALADLIAATSCRFQGFFAECPGPVRMESMMIHWAARVIGLDDPDHWGGYLSSGGSVSTISAVACAREKFQLMSPIAAPSPSGGSAKILTLQAGWRVYMTSQVHSCMMKALVVCGCSPKNSIVSVRTIPHDPSDFAMCDTALETAIREDLKEGYRPWLVVGSAGTVNSGTVDPLEAIGYISKKYGLWFHVDGAYGGLYAMCPEGRERLRGIELADSIVVDPHKTLYLPLGTGMLLVRDKELMKKAHGGDFMRSSPYLQKEIEPEPSDLDSFELSVELSRHFRALRMWLPLCYFGIDTFRAAQSEKIFLARYLHEALSKMNSVVAGPEPHLSVVMFRVLTAGQEDNDRTHNLQLQIVQEGSAFLSGTMIDGIYWIRVAIGNFRTRRRHIDRLLKVIESLASTGIAPLSS